MSAAAAGSKRKRDDDDDEHIAPADRAAQVAQDRAIAAAVARLSDLVYATYVRTSVAAQRFRDAEADDALAAARTRASNASASADAAPSAAPGTVLGRVSKRRRADPEAVVPPSAAVVAATAALRACQWSRDTAAYAVRDLHATLNVAQALSRECYTLFASQPMRLVPDGGGAPVVVPVALRVRNARVTDESCDGGVDTYDCQFELYQTVCTLSDDDHATAAASASAAAPASPAVVARAATFDTALRGHCARFRGHYSVQATEGWSSPQRQSHDEGGNDDGASFAVETVVAATAGSSSGGGDDAAEHAPAAPASRVWTMFEWWKSYRRGAQTRPCGWRPMRELLRVPNSVSNSELLRGLKAALFGGRDTDDDASEPFAAPFDAPVAYGAWAESATGRAALPVEALHALVLSYFDDADSEELEADAQPDGIAKAKSSSRAAGASDDD